MKAGRWTVQPTPEKRDLWRGLVFCAPLWEHGGENVMDIVSGNIGTFVNSPSWERGGLDFTGSARDAVQWSNYLPGEDATAYSLFVAFYVDATDGNGCEIMSIGNHIMMRMDDTGDMEGWYRYSGGFHFLGDATQNHIGKDLRVVFTVDPGNGIHRIWVNSQLEDTTTDSDAILWDQEASTFIGRHPTGDTYDHDGRIFIAAAWDRALTTAEVRALTADPYILVRRGAWRRPVYPHYSAKRT